MVVTPERLSRLSVVLLFVFLVLVTAAVLTFFTRNISLSISLGIILISAIMVVFYSQEIGGFTIFLFALLIIVAALLTFSVENGFLVASIIIGLFVIYSFIR